MSQLRLGPSRLPSETPVADGERRGKGRPDRLWQLVVLLAVLTGLGMRAWSVLGSRAQLNSDEAVEALITVDLLHHGHLPTFFWGQWYGGTAQVPVTAAVMKVIGERSIAIPLVQFGEGLLQAVLVWRIGIRELGARRALLAGALVWVWPAAFVLLQSRPYLFYEITVCFGLVVMLMALRVADRPRDWLRWAGMGLAAGLAFWTSPQSLYYLLPVSLWLLLRLRQSVWRAWAALPTALLGATPWLVANVRHDWRSLSPNHLPDNWLDRLAALVRQGLPLSLGLRISDSLRWLLPGAALLYVAACVALALAFRPAVRGRALHLYVLCAFPVVYAVIPVLRTVANGRYFMFLGAPIALALSSLARRHVYSTGLLLGCTVISLGGTAGYTAHNRPQPTGPVSALLQARGVTHAFAGYWTAYKLTWESHEKVTASPMIFVRNWQYFQAVDGADRIAIVYSSWPGDVKAAIAMQAWLAANKVNVEERQLPGYTVFLPARDVNRADIPTAALVTP